MFFDENKVPYCYWNKRALISTYQRVIIINSILYYELDAAKLLDKDFDELLKNFAALKDKYPKAFNKSQYKYAFEDFDKSTTFDLYYKLNNKDKSYLMRIAKNSLRKDV